MILEKISLHNFRNLQRVFLEPSPAINILVGDNGQGKTNILESIYLLGTLSSHRTANDREMINWDKERAQVDVLLRKRDHSLKLTVTLEGSNKRVQINDTPLEKKSEFIGNLNVVLFSPEDLNLVKGGPSYRRDFLDIEVSQVSRYYHHLLSEYRHVLRQRNFYLKELRDNFKKEYGVLEIWDEKLVELGSRIIEKRLEVVEKLQILARLNQRKITGGKENLSIEYECSLGELNPDIFSIFRKLLVNNRDEEVKRGYTLYGPHRDDLILKVNGMDIRKYGSQGQQRTTALALKLAELEFMKSESGEYPVLLLDDVFSELDQKRKDILLELIAGRIQTFITATDLNILGKLKHSDYKLFKVKQGFID